MSKAKKPHSEAMTEYRCKHCGMVVERSQRKEWIKSFCLDTAKNVHLIRVKRKAKR